MQMSQSRLHSFIQKPKRFPRNWQLYLALLRPVTVSFRVEDTVALAGSLAYAQIILGGEGLLPGTSSMTATEAAGMLRSSSACLLWIR